MVSQKVKEFIKEEIKEFKRIKENFFEYEEVEYSPNGCALGNLLVGVTSILS